MLRLIKPIAFLLVLAIVVPTMAQKKNHSKLAITDLAQVDDDFRFQGEYFGWVLDKTGKLRSAGLQVVALGDGEFQAVEYSGGLPGNGWSKGQGQGQGRQTLTGKRDGQELILRNGTHSIVVSNNTARVHTGASEASDIASLGPQRGELQMVERFSSTLGLRAPRNATVLFDGTNTAAFKNASMTDNGLLKVGTETVTAYHNFNLHLEFRLPYMPHARGQGRSNSGVYLQSRYETQILDSFGLEGKHNECGGLYRQREPDLNMCFPPLTWQTYDIDLQAARFDQDNKKVANARITVRHNGVLIHDDVELTNKTGAGKKESPLPLPTKLQNHSNPVVFRNIWIVDHGNSTQEHTATPSACPVQSTNPLKKLFSIFKSK